jgi:hypothetical protein
LRERNARTKYNSGGKIAVKNAGKAPSKPILENNVFKS